MGIISFFESLNPILGLILKFLLLIWAIEIFFVPFKFNLWYKRSKDIEGLLRDILQETKTNKVTFEDTQRIMSILLKIQDKKNREIRKEKE